MKVNCVYASLEPVSSLKPHPKNPNEHPKEQIERLAKVLDYQGWRYPIKVSKQTGFITSGHGRLLAAKLNGWIEVPVDFQDYETDAQEYADLVSDNAIALWSELDLAAIKNDIEEFPNFHLDLLGIQAFELPDFDAGTEDDQGQLDEKALVYMECPHCGEKFEKQQAQIID